MRDDNTVTIVMTGGQASNALAALRAYTNAQRVRCEEIDEIGNQGLSLLARDSVISLLGAIDAINVGISESGGVRTHGKKETAQDSGALPDGRGKVPCRGCREKQRVQRGIPDARRGGGLPVSGDSEREDKTVSDTEMGISERSGGDV